MRSSRPCLPSSKSLTGTQEGDKFVRLPEVYVKGNNVRAPEWSSWLDAHNCGQLNANWDVCCRSNTYACLMK